MRKSKNRRKARIKLGKRKPIYLNRGGIMLTSFLLALLVSCSTTHNFRFSAEDVSKPSVVYTDSLSIVLPR